MKIVYVGTYEPNKVFKYYFNSKSFQLNQKLKIKGKQREIMWRSLISQKLIPAV